MKPCHHLSVLITVVLLLFGEITKAQTLQVSALATRSICFNDGNITASATGGTLPYTFRLVSGPVVAGFVYPMSPTNNVDQFLSIPAGTYLLRVYDGLGDSAQTNVVVPGNYQFPLLTTVVQNGYTIIATATLGKPPYTYAISSVASNGPFGAQQTSNRFDTLCNGTYYIRVTDSCQNIFTTPGIVISRPRIDATSVSCMAVSAVNHSISVTLALGTGTPPYTYECRSGGNILVNNTGIFNIPGTCPDTIRVTDRCGLWDTISKDCISILDGRTLCSDCVSGSVTITGVGGTAPYSYQRVNTSNVPQGNPNQTGVFTGLPPTTSSYRFRITDACGRTYLYISRCLSLSSFQPCPFNNDLGFSLFGEIQGPVTITCTTCNPPQSITTSSFNAVFTGLSLGTHTFSTSDTCGVPLVTLHTVDTGSISLSQSWRSCNDISISAFNSYGANVTNSTVFVLSGNGYTVTSNNGRFDNIPNGSFIITASYPQCESAFTSITVPNLPDFCRYPTFDDQCNPAYDLKLRSCCFNSDLPEKISFVSVPGGVAQVESPPTGNNGSHFNDLTVGNYNLVSDSGCSVPYNLPAHPVFNLTAYDSVNCLDQQFLFARIQPAFVLTTPCSDTIKFTYKVYDAAGTMLDSSFTGNFIVPDTGDYVIKAFYRVTQPSTYPQVPYANNRACFVDSVHIKARARTLPKVYARDSAVCDINAAISVPYDILGGIPPYTMQVPGLGVYAVQGNHGILNNLGVNNYTLIAYDNCGISNSLTISIIDTCFVCGTLSSFEPLDSVFCVGAAVRYVDTSQHVQQYQWYVNDSLVSTLDALVYTFNSAGDYTVTSIAANISCVDTTIRNIHIISATSFSLGADTNICAYDSVQITSGIGNVLWNSNITAPSITVTQPGTYWASIASTCGTYYDTVQVGFRNFIPPSLAPDQTLCAGDSFLLNAGTSNFTAYTWQDGSTDSVYLALSPGLYWVEVTTDGCRLKDSVEILAGIDAPAFDLGLDTAYCDEISALLQTPYNYTVWNTGDTTSQILVSDAGLYWAKAENECGSHLDSIFLRVIPMPQFTWVSDTFICDNSPYLLYALPGSDSVQWFDGTNTLQKEISSAGTYWITYFEELCSWRDSVEINNYITPHLQLAPDVAECGDEFEIHAGMSGVAYLWNDGSSDSVLLVTQSGTYSITVTNNCGADSALVNVFLMGNDCRLVIPNAFTPNSDGRNDELKVLSLCEVKQFIIRVYNRWGEIIYESSDIQQGWNGSFKGELQPGGTYIIYLSYFDDCKNATDYIQSSVTLIH